ncbi:uncharacterized protein B0H18DRAFT_870049 [Fomitopsis serialis]|uniref:uncharacterized protein n=1 Tax=Fomitopsis serialis TaxID=139415 RepID=UPI002008E507|nr:uncharacterized protein B0H18DRAFT_870049 [Neoantrodia serialis]KAH9934276.1 hypothetical protein B0H18DRAFT_870049 [Neoantrodia serialis]
MAQQDALTLQNTTGTAAAPIQHKERRYQSYPGSNYVLPSDDAERHRRSRRLALQHKLLTQVLESRLILPDVTISPEDHILDSGTGSGTWLLDVMNVVPGTTVLHGLDIEPGLFPQEDNAVVSRGNVQFHVGSITALPGDWNNKFKLINQRLLIGALRKAEWERALSEMFRVVVPGGWVQFGEIVGYKAGPDTARFSALAKAVGVAKDLLADCAARLPDMLRQAGFSQVSVEEKQIPMGSRGGQLAVDARNNWIASFRGMKTPILKAGGFGYVSSEADFDAMVDRMEKEMQDSADAEMKYTVVYAQKPLV